MNTRTRNNKALIFLVVILLLSNIGLLFYFMMIRQPGKRPQGGPPPRGDFSVVEYMKKEVGFNEEQTKSFEQLHNQNRDSLKAIGDSIRSAKNNLYKLLQQPQKPSDSVVNAALSAVSRQQAKLELTMFQHFQKVRALCTPEQQVKLDTMVTRMNNRFPWFRKGGGPRKPDEKDKKPD